MSKVDKIIIFAAVILAFAFIAAGFVLSDIPLRDVANRYAPMVEALASGDLNFAFHPRFQPLCTISAGVVSFLTGFDGFTSLKISAAIWYFAGMFLLYHLVRLLYPQEKRIAAFSVLLYAVFPHLLHMAFAGLREPAKTFLLLLSAVSLVRIYLEPEKKLNYILLGIASGLCVIAKSDMTITGVFILFSGVFLECRHRKTPLYSFLSYAVFWLIMFPNIYINMRLFNVAVPEWRYAVIWKSFTGNDPGMLWFFLYSAVLFVLIYGTAPLAALIFKKAKAKHIFFSIGVIFAVSVIYTAASSSSSGEEIRDYINSFSEGFYDFLGLFVLLYLIIRSYFKTIDKSELIVLAVICANALCNIMPILLFEQKLFISSRYLHPAMPLFFGFFLCGIRDLYEIIKSYTGRKFALPLLILCSLAIAFGMIYHAFQPTIRDYTRKRNIRQRRKVFELKQMVVDDYRGKRFLPVDIQSNYYVSNRRPKLFFIDDNKISAAAYLTGGSVAWSAGAADYIVAPYLPEDVPSKLTLIGKVQGYRQIFKVWRVEK